MIILMILLNMLNKMWFVPNMRFINWIEMSSVRHTSLIKSMIMLTLISQSTPNISADICKGTILAGIDQLLERSGRSAAFLYCFSCLL